MIKCSTSLAFYLFSPTCLINSIIHEHSIQMSIFFSVRSQWSVISWVNIQNFKNPEPSKFKSQNLLYAYKVLTISSLNGQLPKDELKINKRTYQNLPNSGFWGWLSVESQSWNPEFRNNPENFHQCYFCACLPGPEVMLNSTEHESYSAHTC